MIRTFAVTNTQEVKLNLPLDMLSSPEISWYWVDFNQSDEKEGMLLADHFHFHPLAIEDCFNYLQRPKLDYYENYFFFVFHSILQESLTPDELDVFLGSNFIVTYHRHPSREVETVWQRFTADEASREEGLIYAFYHLIDKMVDSYFPILYEIEDQLNMLENQSRDQRSLMNDVFDIRSDLLKLRKIIIPMRELLYRMLNAERLENIRKHREYFTDIYDHLLKLSEMIESNREMTADIRDNYLSLSANRTNSIMMTLTVITVIFMPLTFIVGIYGMNFDYMPELKWHYGYFAVLGFMALIAVLMFFWFKRKGWFEG